MRATKGKVGASERNETASQPMCSATTATQVWFAVSFLCPLVSLCHLPCSSPTRASTGIRLTDARMREQAVCLTIFWSPLPLPLVVPTSRPRTLAVELFDFWAGGALVGVCLGPSLSRVPPTGQPTDQPLGCRCLSVSVSGFGLRSLRKPQMAANGGLSEQMAACTPCRHAPLVNQWVPCRCRAWPLHLSGVASHGRSGLVIASEGPFLLRSRKLDNQLLLWAGIDGSLILKSAHTTQPSSAIPSGECVRQARSE